MGIITNEVNKDNIIQTVLEFKVEALNLAEKVGVDTAVGSYPHTNPKPMWAEKSLKRTQSPVIGKRANK